jgi:hypothetical protein
MGVLMAIFRGLYQDPHEVDSVPLYVLDIITVLDDEYEGVTATFGTHFGHGRWQVDIVSDSDELGIPVCTLSFEPHREDI